MVAGYSGIGKTSVVGEIHKPITARRGWFAQGKFDQFRRDSPYTALIQAFRELIRQVLTESEEQLARFKSELLEALGPNGQLLIEVIPEIELITGPQPAVAALGAGESLNRFNFVLGQFVRVWAQEQHPLVLFLDDLQWAGDASLRLMQALVTDRQSHHLLIVGAYRDNEVSASHPLVLTFDEIRKSGLTPREITLGPLPPQCVEELIEDSLHCSPDQSKPLAALLEQRTQGNPFFLNQLLKSWQENKLITRVNGRWSWDLNVLGALNLSGDVVELMAGKIQTLPDATQEVLKLAACIGNRFDARTLATVRETEGAQVAADLWEALRAGLISPLGGALRYSDDESNVTYKFLHDRVQQAAYSLVGDDERGALHLKIGRLLFADEATRDEGVFDIVGHLNEARALISDGEERQNVVRSVIAAIAEGKHAPSTQCHYYMWKARLHYFWGDYAAALEMAREAQLLSSALLATPYIPELFFFHSLILAALYSQASETEKTASLKQVRKNQKQMKIWATNAPENYRHKYLLVAAEIAHIKGRDNEAAGLYDQAIRAARDAEYTQNEALANELAARFYQSNDRKTLASSYLDDARYLYEKWGAHAKVAALDAATSPHTKSEKLDHQRTTSGNVKDKSSQLDLSTVIKASQAISGKIDLGRLLQQLLRFALENAGATRGALILRRDNDTALIDGIEVHPVRNVSLVAERERASIRGNGFGLTAHNTYLGAEWEVRPKLALRIGSQNGQTTYGVGFERGRFDLQAARVGDVADKELAPIFGQGNHFTIVQAGYQF